MMLFSFSFCEAKVFHCKSSVTALSMGLARGFTSLGVVSLGMVASLLPMLLQSQLWGKALAKACSKAPEQTNSLGFRN
jgi:hypothetical protein